MLILTMAAVAASGLSAPPASAQIGAQSAVVRGRIVDKESKSPLPYVEVFIKSIGRGSVSNEAGEFVIENVPPGRYSVIFKRQGYETIREKNLHLQPGAILDLNIEMSTDVLEADELVVTATRNVEFEHDIPQLVSIVTEQEIREKNITQTPELLREEQGVYVQKTNQGGGSPLIRGLKANKILLLVDGIRLNNATYRGGNVQYSNSIDAKALGKIEVVHGPVSALYGSDALGGAINMITRTPSLHHGTGLRWDATLSSLLSSADRQRGTHFGLSLAGRRLGLVLDASFKSYGDINRGTHGGEALQRRLASDSRVSRRRTVRQSPNGYDAYDLATKFVFQPGELHEFTIAYQLNRQPSVPRYDAYETQRFSQWLYDPQERDLGYVSYKYTRPTALFTYAAATLSLQRQFERRIKQRAGRTTRSREAFETVTRGLQLQLNRVLSDRFFASYGFELYRDRVTAASSAEDLKTGERAPINTLYPDGSTYRSFGAFLQGEAVLARPWIIDAGVRYSTFRLRAPFSPGSTGSVDLGTVAQSLTALTGSIGSTVRLSESVNLVANIAQGFRAPNLDDVSKLGLGKGGGFFDVPNPGLGPEKVLAVDGGIKIAGRLLRANAIFYYSDFTDLMVRRPATFKGRSTILDDGVEVPVFRKENTGRAYITGLELGAQVLLAGSLSLKGNLTYTYGQNAADNEPLQAIPPLNGFASLRLDRRTYWLELNMRFATEQSRLAAEDLKDLRIPQGGTPGWWTLGFRSALFLTRKLRAQLALTNIFDLDYREHLSGFDAPGRNFIISLALHLQKNKSPARRKYR